jgi:hypothetical protein
LRAIRIPQQLEQTPRVVQFRRSGVAAAARQSSLACIEVARPDTL